MPLLCGEKSTTPLPSSPSKTTLGTIRVFPGRYLDTTEKAAGEDSPLALRHDRAYIPMDKHLFVPITLPPVLIMRLMVDFLLFCSSFVIPTALGSSKGCRGEHRHADAAAGL